MKNQTGLDAALAGFCLDSPEISDAVMRLASGGIPVGLVFSVPMAAPLLSLNAQLEQFPLTAAVWVTSERLMMTILRHGTTHFESLWHFLQCCMIHPSIMTL